MFEYLDELLIEEHDLLPSTQDYARDLIINNRGRHGLTISAKNQSQGYGKARRAWFSYEGNIMMTIIVNVPKIEEPQFATFVGAVAVGNTLLSLCPSIDIKYKWINDVMIEGKKISGILTEYYGEKWLLVGISVNIKDKPTIPNYPTICLNDIMDIDKSAVILELAKNFCQTFNDWQMYGNQHIYTLYTSRVDILSEKRSFIEISHHHEQRSCVVIQE